MFDISGAVLKFTENIESTAVLRHVIIFFEGGSRLRSRVIFGDMWCPFWRFKGHLGAKMKLKSILRHLMGLMAP